MKTSSSLSAHALETTKFPSSAIAISTWGKKGTMEYLGVVLADWFRGFFDCIYSEEIVWQGAKEII